jgi:predicted glycosyltransferase
MPTKHARIALTRDPELDAALKAAAPALGASKPDATLARELVLRGAQAVLADPGAELDRWLEERGGVIRAARTFEEARALARELTKDAPPGGPSISEMLEEERAERL